MSPSVFPPLTVLTVSNQSDRAEDHKILSDRRSEGGGIAWLAKFSRPPVKLIKIVATAGSDEHVSTSNAAARQRPGRSPSRMGVLMALAGLRENWHSPGGRVGPQLRDRHDRAERVMRRAAQPDGGGPGP
jgi:hypothetical protein